MKQSEPPGQDQVRRSAELARSAHQARQDSEYRPWQARAGSRQAAAASWARGRSKCAYAASLVPMLVTLAVCAGWCAFFSFVVEARFPEVFPFPESALVPSLLVVLMACGAQLMEERWRYTEIIQHFDELCGECVSLARLAAVGPGPHQQDQDHRALVEGAVNLLVAVVYAVADRGRGAGASRREPAPAFYRAEDWHVDDLIRELHAVCRSGTARPPPQQQQQQHQYQCAQHDPFAARIEKISECARRLQTAHKTGTKAVVRGLAAVSCYSWVVLSPWVFWDFFGWFTLAVHVLGSWHLLALLEAGARLSSPFEDPLPIGEGDRGDGPMHEDAVEEAAWNAREVMKRLCEPRGAVKPWGAREQEGQHQPGTHHQQHRHQQHYARQAHRGYSVAGPHDRGSAGRYADLVP